MVLLKIATIVLRDDQGEIHANPRVIKGKKDQGAVNKFTKLRTTGPNETMETCRRWKKVILRTRGGESKGKGMNGP